MAKKIENGGRPPSWILKISIFGHVTVIEFQICIRIPNFIEIEWLSLRYTDLQYDVRALSWIFEIEFMARDLYHRAILLPCAKCHKYHRNDSTSACIIHFIYILVLKYVIGSDVVAVFWVHTVLF